MKEKVLQAIKDLREKSGKRKFPQTFDLIINLKEFDIKRPENKINESAYLPKGRGKEAKVVIFSDRIKDADAEVLNASDIEKISKSKSMRKKLARDTDFFLAEANLMPVIGKSFGQMLAPRGKMPKLISGDLTESVETLKKSTRIRIKDAPVIQCLIGNENMKDEDVVENIESVIKFLDTKLPKGKVNIGKVLLKLTMSKPVKLEV